MILSELKNRLIKNVYYVDELGGIGIESNSEEFHLVEYGNIFFEMVDGSVFEISNEIEHEGIEISENEAANLNKLQKNKIANDKHWGSISEKLIDSVITFKSKIYVTNGSTSKTKPKEIVSTLKIIFKNGERVFISNAGYLNKSEIRKLTGDFIIYRKKSIGRKLKILNQ